MKPRDPHADPQPRDPIGMQCLDEHNSILSYTGAGFSSRARLIVGIDFGTTCSGVAFAFDDTTTDYCALSYSWGDQEDLALPSSALPTYPGMHDWPTNIPKTTTTMTESRYEGFVLKKAKPLVGERCPWDREHRQGDFSRRSDLWRHTVREDQLRHLCQKCGSKCHQTPDTPQVSVDAYPEATHQARWSLDDRTTEDHDPGDNGHKFECPPWLDETCRQCSCPQLSR